MQKGATGVVVVVILGAIALLGGGWLVFRGEEPEPVTVVPEAAEVAQETRAPATPFAYVPLGRGIARTSRAVYYQSGTGASGEPEYREIPNANPETFTKIATVIPPPKKSAPAGIGGGSGFGSASFTSGSSGSGASQSASQSQTPSANTPAADSGNQDLGSASDSSYSVSYYTDGDSVYIVVEQDGVVSTPQVIPGADPDTLEILNAEYITDDDTVYVVTVTCTESACSVAVAVVQGADPDSFVAYASAQQVSNSDCTGYVTADAQSDQYLYNNGQIVDGISVYLIGQNGECYQEPVLVSP